jgi:hypothetical protein
MRLGFYWAAWGTVILAVLAINPAYLLKTPAFPIGLLIFLPDGQNKVSHAFLWGPLAWVAGWTVYCALSYLMSRVRRNWQFFLIYFVFCLLLALNVVGCKAAMESVGQTE